MSLDNVISVSVLMDENSGRAKNSDGKHSRYGELRAGAKAKIEFQSGAVDDIDMSYQNHCAYRDVYFGPSAPGAK